MSIVVGKKWDAQAQYIGRGSPLGNPFVMKSEADRDRVCDQYAVWFDERVKAGNALVIARAALFTAWGALVLYALCLI